MDKDRQFIKDFYTREQQETAGKNSCFHKLNGISAKVTYIVWKAAHIERIFRINSILEKRIAEGRIIQITAEFQLSFV